MDLIGLNYQTIRKLLLQQKITSRQLTEKYLHNINEGTEINAFISIFNEDAICLAREVDKKLLTGQAGILAGMVLGIKDNINIRDFRTTCGSKILSNFISPYNATVIQKLKEADCIFIGKTNMDEFGMGSSNENSYFGPVQNPVSRSKVPGGSSGGSAAAVAAGLVTASLGSDTGGSIRQPAAFCGVVGVKPTYGRVSRYGLVAYGSSLDQIGPIASNVRDCAQILEVIAGFDPKDATSANIAVPEYSKQLDRGVKGMVFGLPIDFFGEGLNSEIRMGILKAADILKKHGARVISVPSKYMDFAVPAYYIIVTAEASSNLARFDGARFGFRAEEFSDLEEMYVNTRTLGFGGEVKRRIMLGTFVLSGGYYETYYQKAQKVRRLIKKSFDWAFQKCDCLLTPVVPTTAFGVGEKTHDPLSMYLSDIYTVSANLAGIPAMSLPCGIDSSGLPMGIQIMANHFDEATMFQVAYFLEKHLT